MSRLGGGQLRLAAAFLAASTLAGCRCDGRDAATKPAVPEVNARLVIVGVDGLDPAVLEELVARRRLPNISRLHRTPLETTSPSDPATAWASLVTGTPPGAHGITGDVMRGPGTYALSGIPVEERDGKLRSLRAGDALWTTLSRSGKRARVLRAPCSFPPPDIEAGEVLSGPGTPDLAGGSGSYIVIRSSAAATPPAGGRLLVAAPLPAGGWEAVVPGPGTGGDALRATLRMSAGKGPDGQQELRVTGGTREVVAVLGQWSEWLEITFEGGGRKVTGLARLLPRQAGPGLEVIMEPPGQDPYAPLLPLSSPRYYSGFLAERYGRFRTTGRLVDERAFSSGAVGMGALLRQVYASWEQQERMTIGEMGREGWDLFVTFLPQTGPALRILARVGDQDLPARDGDLDAAYGDNVEKIYLRLDAMVGEIMKGLSASDRLIVVSARGLRSVRREVDLGAWLVKQKLLVLSRRAKSSPREGLEDVDWSATRAYSAAGGIFLNLAGREPGGIVEASEADDERSRIRDALLMLRDEGRPVVKEVLSGSAVFAGPAADRAPDLIVVLQPGYGFSPLGYLGGVSPRVVADSDAPWVPAADGGDPVDASGVLLSTLPPRGKPSVLDIAPTVLGFFGIKTPPSYAGHDLW